MMPPFLDFSNGEQQDPKMHVSIGELPLYIDRAQPPTKKSPWRQVNSVPFVQCATMTMPDEMYELIWGKLEQELRKARYAKVIIKLQDLLEGEFFTEFVKKGNVLMLSEGQPGVDNIFSLRDGVLRLDLDKDSHERVGLQGKAVRSGGRKHIKSRFLIEEDLRKPSMIHGKRGFERLVWAAKNVLHQSMTWLFYNLQDDSPKDISTSLLEKHHPTWVNIAPNIATRRDVSIPDSINTSFNTMPSQEDKESYYEIVEWLGLVALGSPLIVKSNDSSQHFNQYSAPEGTSSVGNLRVVQWQGFLTRKWVTDLLISTINQTWKNHAERWLAFSVSAHRTEAQEQHNGYMIILRPGVDGKITVQDAMDTDEPVEGQVLDREKLKIQQEGEVEASKHQGGLRNYTCFEHIGTVV